MIRKIKKRFILLSMLPLLLVMLTVMTVMNVVNYISLTDDADITLDIIMHNVRVPSDMSGLPAPDYQDGPLHDSRYFTVDFNALGEVTRVDTSRMPSVDNDRAVGYARSVPGDDSGGFVGSMRYMRSYIFDGVRVAFLDCSYQIDWFRTFAISSIIVSLLVYFLVFLVVVILADRIIKPFAESYEKQKRFITDAGHEIKTPLTIISANVDLMEMEYGENEYVAELRQQVSNMRELTSALVYLAKMEEEQQNNIPRVSLAFSEIVEELAASFTAPAQLRGLSIDARISPMLSVIGDDKTIRALISILMDNAVKYAKESSTVTLRAVRQPRYVVLTVENDTDQNLDRDKIELVFERFWRSDMSRNSLSGGSGIGLSIARAIVENHNGKITASFKDGRVAFVVFLPFG